METVSTGVLDTKEHYLRSKDKAEKPYDVLTHMRCHMSQYKNNEDLQSIVSNLMPNWCLKVDFQKVDKHTGGNWLIHDTKRGKDNQLQSLKLPSRISKLSSLKWDKGSDGAMLIFWYSERRSRGKTTLEVSDSRTPNT